jgi:Ser/Thr protein kinase RdoA (MazF antagonist)
LLQAKFIRGFLAEFATQISPRLATLRSQFVHNDFNARNVIVDPTDESRVVGVIDFGDSVHTALVADVAVGVIGQLAAPETADESIREFVRSYCEVEPLSSEELAVLPRLIAGRIVHNVVMTSWHRARNPGGTHFDGFDAAYFEWRIALARRLAAEIS